MPRRPRIASGGFAYHVLNRAVGRGAAIFKTMKDYAAFEKVLEEAREHVDMRLLSFCLMPTHWHLVLWPLHDGDLSEYMRWLTNTHTRRWHLAHGTVGTGPLYQGRFKSFPIQEDEHFTTVCRYVERNALRAGLVRRAEDWQWSSLWRRMQRKRDVTLAAWPVPRSRRWLEFVNGVDAEAELKALRRSANRGTPFGASHWRQKTAKLLGLESSLRDPGRPIKTPSSKS